MSKVRQHLLASGKNVPVTRLGPWLGLPRSTAYYQPRQRKPAAVDGALAARMRRIHQDEPACAVRGTWSRLRSRDGIQVNRKKVHRLMKLKGWTLPKRIIGRRPRVEYSRSPAAPAGAGPPT
jgi:putative transposase